MFGSLSINLLAHSLTLAKLLKFNLQTATSPGSPLNCSRSGLKFETSIIFKKGYTK